MVLPKPMHRLTMMEGSPRPVDDHDQEAPSAVANGHTIGGDAPSAVSPERLERMESGAAPVAPEAPSSRDAEPVRRGVGMPLGFEGSSQRAGRLLMMTVRSIFIVLIVTVTALVFSSTTNTHFTGWTLLGVLVAGAMVGVIVVLVDLMTPNKRLSSVVGVYIGISVGLVAAVGFGALIEMIMSAWELDKVPLVRIYTNLVKVVIGLIICYLTVIVVLTTKDDFRLVIPYVEFARQRRGLRPMLVDSSALIDGRVRELAASGFLDASLIIPRFVLEELQRLADSGDRQKRQRGRRGLDLVAELQRTPEADVSIEAYSVEGMPVDRMLLEVARKENMRVLTTDSNLQKLGGIQGVTVLNLHQLSAAVRPVASVGDALTVTIAREGENEGQGVGFLPDGTMVVVDDAASRVGEVLAVTVTNTLQTQAGRLVFARVEPLLPDGSPSAAPRMAEAATSQPRVTGRPAGRSESAPSRGRNPRR